MSKLASNLKQVGLALGGGTYPTAASSFTRGLLVSAFSCNPKINLAPVPEVRGTFNTFRVTKNAAKDFDLSMSMPLDCGDNTGGDIGYLLYAILGVDTKSGSGPYTHRFTLLDDSNPPYLNIFSDKDAVNPKQYLGFRPQSLTFKLKAGDGIVNVDVKGIVVDEAAIATQTLVFSGAPVVSPQEAVLSNTDGPILWEEMDITITRDVERRRVVGSSRLVRDTPTKGFMIKFTGKGLQFATEAIRNRFLAGTSDLLSLLLTDASANYLKFNFPEMYFDTFDGPDIKDKTLLDVSMGGFITNSTYYVELQNLRSTAYSA